MVTEVVGRAMINPLEGLSNEACSFAFGLCVSTAADQRAAGRLSSLAEELDRRGVLDPLLESLEPGVRAGILAAVRMDRGARWSRFGQRS